jgi:transcriptional regulator with XRE-family HTH domain
MSFGKVLRELRKKANMTQEQLAQQLAISPQAVSRWETDFAMPDISLIVPIAEIFEVSTDILLGHNYKEIDLRVSQCFDGKNAFREGLRALNLVDTIYACEIIEKILELVFEDKNYLDFHELWVHILTTKARLLNEEGKYEASIEALKKAQLHAKELDKVEFHQPHTSKIFKGVICALSPEYQAHCNLYHLNTAIVRNKEQQFCCSNSKHYQKLVEEIKTEGKYCKE